MSRPHCLKMKMNGKNLSKFQFHFPGLLGTFPMLKQETKKCLIIGHFETLDNFRPFLVGMESEIAYFFRRPFLFCH